MSKIPISGIAILSACLILQIYATTDLNASPGKLEHLDFFGRGIRAFNARLFNEADFWFWTAEQTMPIPGGPGFPGQGRYDFPYLPHYYRGLALLGADRLKNAKQELAAAREQWENLADRRLQNSLKKSFQGNVDFLILAIGALESCQEPLDAGWRDVYASPDKSSGRYKLLRSLQRSQNGLVFRLKGHLWQPYEVEKLASLHNDIVKFKMNLENELALSRETTSIRSAALTDFDQKASCCLKQEAVSKGFYPRTDYGKKYAIIISPVKYGCNKAGENCDPDLTLKEIDKLASNIKKTLGGQMGFEVIDEVKMVLDKYKFRESLWAAIRKTRPGDTKVDSVSNEGDDEPEKNLVIVFYAGHACRPFLPGYGPQVVLPTSSSPLCSSVPSPEVAGSIDPSRKAARERAARKLIETSLRREDFELELAVPSGNHVLLIAETCYSGDLASRLGEYLRVQPSERAVEAPFYGVVASAAENELSSSDFHLMNAFYEFFRKCGARGDDKSLIVPGLSMLKMISASLADSPIVAKYNEKGFVNAEFFVPIRSSCCPAGDPACPLFTGTVLPGGVLAPDSAQLLDFVPNSRDLQ